MLLCVDVGNTQIALGIYADEAGAADEVDPPLVRQVCAPASNNRAPKSPSSMTICEASTAIRTRTESHPWHRYS